MQKYSWITKVKLSWNECWNHNGKVALWSTQLFMNIEGHWTEHVYNPCPVHLLLSLTHCPLGYVAVIKNLQISNNTFEWMQDIYLFDGKYIFIQENAFINVVCEMTAIMPLPQCVKQWCHGNCTFILLDMGIPKQCLVASWQNSFCDHMTWCEVYVYIYVCIFRMRLYLAGQLSPDLTSNLDAILAGACI